VLSPDFATNLRFYGNGLRSCRMGEPNPRLDSDEAGLLASREATSSISTGTGSVYEDSTIISSAVVLGGGLDNRAGTN